VAPLRALLCSRNESKLREFRAALPDWELDLLDVDGYPPEDGASYYENARGKVEFGRSVEPSAWLLADDSGIEVAALGGAPGVATARWAEDGVARLLDELAGAEDRRARYVCELVALSSAGRELRGTGVLEGSIAHERRGTEGFGYDPVFVPVDALETVAELGDAWKARSSHRARAASALLSAVAAVD
jgi:XTP/dITP diphosphohydrolase